MATRRKAPRGQASSGQAAVQVGQAGGNVTVIHQTHHHYPGRNAPTRQPLLVLPVYELHQLPRRHVRPGMSAPAGKTGI